MAAEDSSGGYPEVGRQEVQAAIAKVVELRALHAALVHGSSTNSGSPSSNFRFPITAAASLSSPALLHASHFSAQDYPVFKPVRSFFIHPFLISFLWISIAVHGFPLTRPGSLEGHGLENRHGETETLSSMKEFASNLTSLEPHICPAEDQKSVTSSMVEASQGAEFDRSSCNQCKPAVITTEPRNASRNNKNSKVVVPVTNSSSSVRMSQAKGHGISLARLFPQLKKKNAKEGSSNRTESEEVSQVSKDVVMSSVEVLKNELIEANRHRDAAMMEVTEMKSSLEELRQKLEYLETYCEGLKRALRQATQAKDWLRPEKDPSRGKPWNWDGSMPVSEEAMAEGFLNSLLQPYSISLSTSNSKAALYHVEAIINQMLYQDFENCTFQKSGPPKILDPEQDRRAKFASFVALRNLSWNEVLRKGTKYYSQEFSKFCDQKMSCIIKSLNWTRQWPEQLLQAFFVAAKCIWLLHLLAFSFSPPLGILRVEENRTFESHYMEDILADRQRSNGPSRVKVMVMPGFYVQESVLRCKVICRYRSVT